MAAQRLEEMPARIKSAPPMTPEQIEAQRQSWVRGMCTPCEHGVLDFETCPDCRNPEGE